MRAVWDVSEATARPSDPDTSHQAAASVQNRTEAQEEILRVLRKFGPLCDADIDLKASYTQASPSGLRTRRSELVRRGLVRDSGKRATLPSGRQSIIWEIVND